MVRAALRGLPLGRRRGGPPRGHARRDARAARRPERHRADRAGSRGRAVCDRVMSATVDGYADQVMTLIAADIAAGIVPDRVSSFTALHCAVDANGYIEAAGVPWGARAGHAPVNAG